MFATQSLAVGELNRVGVDKPRVRPEEIEVTRLERFRPVDREIANDPLFPLVHRFHVGARPFYSKAELGRVLCRVQDLGGVDQRLRRHAATEDTQATELLGTVNDGDFPAEAGGDTGRVVTCAATADANKIVGPYFSHRGTG